MKKERLISLDILRGADIFVLTVVSVIIAVVNKYHPLPGWLLTQFDHPEWIGFSFYDIIMPLFIFMSGASVPLANPKWAHVLRRFALLWVFGMVAQGELLTFDLHRIRSELKGWTKVTRLALIGVGLLILGAILNTFDPCVKHIFTASFTSYVMGVCFLLYGLCYALFDVLKIAKGTKLMTLFGRNSLLAYMLHEIANLVR